MQLFEGVWATITAVLRFASLSPVPDSIVNDQVPLLVPQPLPSVTQSIAPFPVAQDAPPGPTFAPPGASPGFVCEYPEMKGWEYCGDENHRQCWLQRKSDGNRYDVFTNYEDLMPKGVNRYYQLNLTDSWWDADGVNFTAAKLYNDTYPGPWIQACWGDQVYINVTNSLRHNGTSVHWHGIRQLDTMHMDGVNGVTQCPIARNDYFLYNWTARQYGSAWYHSHYSVQYADGAAGPLTLYGPTSANYDEAVKPILMTDWGHKSAFVAHAQGELNQRDILLNGRGNITRYNNTRQPDKGIKIEAPYTLNFTGYQQGKPVKKYLLRIINVSYDTTFVVSIDNHLMQIVSTDFVPITPYTNTSVLVGIGQRYNVIVEANPIVNPLSGPLDAEGNYWIRTYVANCFEMKGGDVGYEQSGIIRYNPLSTADPTSCGWKKVTLSCSDETYTDIHPIFQWNVTDPRPSKMLDNALKPVYNATAQPSPYPLAAFSLDLEPNFVPMRVDYADPPFLHLDNGGNWTEKAWRIIPENKNSTDWIYMVIKSPGPHPMHLHGHDFAILEQAYYKNFSLDTLNLQLLNPPRRDVVLLPTKGYVVIAFKADNPGAWLVHCHIADHISWGLGLTIMERQDSAFKIWPNNDSAIVEARRVCDNWKRWQGNPKNWANNTKCMADDRVKDKNLCFQDDSGV